MTIRTADRSEPARRHPDATVPARASRHGRGAPGAEGDTFGALCRRIGLVPEMPAWPDAFGAALAAWVSARGETPIRTLSLFSGAGGLDIGFHDAGFHVVEAVEINPRYAATLRANTGAKGYLGQCQVRCLDIHDYTPAENLCIDFVIGGPPCQSFSAAGRRASGVAGVNDARGTLFQEYVRVLKAVQPKGFLFENVYGLTGANQGKAWENIQAAFGDAGYVVSSRVLDAADYGVPQHRDRLFIVGVRKGSFLFPRPTHGPDSPEGRPHFNAGGAVEGAAGPTPPQGIRGRYGPLLDQVPPGLNYSFFTERMGHPAPVFAWRSKFSDFLYKADPTRPVRTIKAQGGQYTGPFHWGSRPFSVSELSRLQTFPDSYQVLGSRNVAIQQLGNSVPPQAARLLALAVRLQVFGRAVPAPVSLLAPEESLGFRLRKRALTKVYSARAARALSAPGVARSRQLKPQTVVRSLGEGFAWNSQRCEGAFRVASRPGRRTWSFDLSAAQHPQAPVRFEIEVEPRTAWSLPVKRITLRSRVPTLRAFCACWKAFEEQLAGSQLKADLVQLAGYYQYECAIVASLTLHTRVRGDVWKVLQSVVSGRGTRETASAVALAEAWSVPVVDVPRLALELRGVGYEVRNRSTNSEIPHDAYLVPYPFPTLNPQSVQLHKRLG